MEPAAVQRGAGVDAYLDRTVTSRLEVVAHVVSELQDEVGLRRHLAFLDAVEVTVGLDLPNPAVALAAHDEGHGAVLLADHDAPRETHALLVPAHVAAVRQEPER